jgi:hypothetical protein
MGPFLVVPPDEVIDEGLLQGVGRRRLDGFGLQGQTHPLVAAVLLGMPGLDALDVDPETQPPHGELTQTVQGIRAGKGNAGVGTRIAGDSAKSLRARSNAAKAYVSRG